MAVAVLQRAGLQAAAAGSAPASSATMEVHGSTGDEVVALLAAAAIFPVEVTSRGSSVEDLLLELTRSQGRDRGQASREDQPGGSPEARR